jgi:hypothetical protein
LGIKYYRLAVYLKEALMSIKRVQATRYPRAPDPQRYAKKRKPLNASEQKKIKGFKPKTYILFIKKKGEGHFPHFLNI